MPSWQMLRRPPCPYAICPNASHMLLCPYASAPICPGARHISRRQLCAPAPAICPYTSMPYASAPICPGANHMPRRQLYASAPGHMISRHMADVGTYGIKVWLAPGHMADALLCDLSVVGASGRREDDPICNHCTSATTTYYRKKCCGIFAGSNYQIARLKCHVLRCIVLIFVFAKGRILVMSRSQIPLFTRYLVQT